MLGRKSREIRELNKELEEMRPYADTARMLHDRAQVQVDTTGEDEIQAQLHDDIVSGLVVDGLRQRIADLPTASFLDLYRKVGDGQESVLRQLGELVTLQAQKRTREARWNKIGLEVAASGRFNLSEVAPGDLLQVGLFAKSEPDHKKKYPYRPYTGRRLSLRCYQQSESGPTFEAIDDTVQVRHAADSDVWQTKGQKEDNTGAWYFGVINEGLTDNAQQRLLRKLELVQVGVIRPNQDQSLEPWLGRNVGFAIQREGRAPVPEPYDVGYAVLGNKIILGAQ